VLEGFVAKLEPAKEVENFYIIGNDLLAGFAEEMTSFCKAQKGTPKLQTGRIAQATHKAERGNCQSGNPRLDGGL
jgi:hypothetical protein